MKEELKLKRIINESESGVITTKEITEAGLHRGLLRKLVDNGEIYPVSRGLYIRNDAWEDDFYIIQNKYKRGIYSHDTALYLLGYSDRTPERYTMTFPKGYNSASLKNECVNIKRVVPDNYSFGVLEVSSPSGNPIYIYELERTLCDILRGNESDIQIVNYAMKKYALSKDKDIHKLMKYAEKLHVKNKVLKYMEVLL